MEDCDLTHLNEQSENRSVNGLINVAVRSKKNPKKNLKKQQRIPQKTQSKTKMKTWTPGRMKRKRQQRYWSRRRPAFLYPAKLGRGNIKKSGLQSSAPNRHLISNSKAGANFFSLKCILLLFL